MTITITERTTHCMWAGLLLTSDLLISLTIAITIA